MSCRFLERVLGGGQGLHGRGGGGVQRLEALTAEQAGGHGAGLGLWLEAGGEGTAAEERADARADGMAAQRAHVAMQAAEANVERKSVASERARARFTEVIQGHCHTAPHSPVPSLH